MNVKQRGAADRFGRVNDSNARGAVAEHLAVVELLKRGHTVAIPVVDDDGVDLVVNYRTTVQVKSSSRRNLQPVPGYHYPAFAWGHAGANWKAAIFLLHANGESGDRWFVVPEEAVRHAKDTLQLYEGMKHEFQSGRKTIGGIVASFEDRWDLFDAERVVDEGSRNGGCDG